MQKQVVWDKMIHFVIMLSSFFVFLWNSHCN